MWQLLIDSLSFHRTFENLNILINVDAVFIQSHAKFSQNFTNFIFLFLFFFHESS